MNLAKLRSDESPTKSTRQARIISLVSDSCANPSTPNMPPCRTLKWHALRPYGPRSAGDEKNKTPSQTYLAENHEALCVRHSAVHGIPHIAVRIAARCVLHRYSSQDIHRCKW